MGLRWFYILCFSVGLSSCNWFDPFDIPNVEEDFKCVSYFMPIESDTSICFLSRSFDLYGPNSTESLDFCAKIKSPLNEVVACQFMEADTSSVWINTRYLEILTPGDSLFLEIESSAFDIITSSSVVPEHAEIASYSMSSRSYFNGGKYFDDIVLELSDPSPMDEAYMIQLILHIDTIGAPMPSIRNLKSDDANMIRRSFGEKMLDNALFFEGSFWEDGNYSFLFRTKNNIEEGVPYHYTLLVHSISMDMYRFFYDLEASDMTGYFNGGSFAVYSNVDGAHGCFGTMQTSHALLFP